MPNSPSDLFYVSFGLGSVHRKSFATVYAPSRDTVIHYGNKGLFPGYSHVYTPTEWAAMDWTKDLTQIPVTEILP
jgi:hypothetical protein